LVLVALGAAARDLYRVGLGIAYYVGVEALVRRGLQPYLSRPRTWTMTFTEDGCLRGKGKLAE